MVSLTPALAKEYEALWASCEIDYQPEIARQSAAKLLKNKARYQGVSSVTGVPWYWIAICHNRESSGNFLGVLHNGEKIIGTGRKTKLVPAGRGPFATWEEAAIDALKIKGLDKNVEWNVGRFWYECERFNGFGYRNKGVPSPYLWSHTNHYKDFAGDMDKGGGKYVADHVYDPSVHDTQFGCAAILKALIALDPEITFGQAAPAAVGQPLRQPEPLPEPLATQPVVQPKPEVSEVQPPSKPSIPAGATGSGAAAVATGGLLLLGLPWYYAVGLAVVGAGLLYTLYRISKSKGLPKEKGPKSLSGKSDTTKEVGRSKKPNSPPLSPPAKGGLYPTRSEESK